MSFATPWKTPFKTSSLDNSQPVSFAQKPTKAAVVKQKDIDNTDQENKNPLKIAKQKKSKVAEVGAADRANKVVKPRKKNGGKISAAKKMADSAVKKVSTVPTEKPIVSSLTSDCDLFANNANDEDLLNDSDFESGDPEIAKSSVLCEQNAMGAKTKKASVSRRQKSPMKVTAMVDYDDLFAHVLQNESVSEPEKEQDADAPGSASTEVEINAHITVSVVDIPQSPALSVSTPKSHRARTSSPAQPDESAVTPEVPRHSQEAGATSQGQGVTPLNTFLAPKQLKRIANAPQQKKARTLLGGVSANPRRIDFERVANEETPNRPKPALPFVAKVAHKYSVEKEDRRHSAENAQRKIVFGSKDSNSSVEKKKRKKKRSRVATESDEESDDSALEEQNLRASQHLRASNQSRDAGSQSRKRHKSDHSTQGLSDHRILSGTMSSQNILTQTLSQVSTPPLSQPPKTLTARERLEWYQKRRDVGVWVRCDKKSCDKWRYLPDTKDPLTLPDLWYCSMHPDKALNSCQAPEFGPSLAEEQDLIHNLYTAGSLVWARLDGFPWWPAMIDDCPDTEQYYWLNGFSDIPTHYNVVFFDDSAVTRAWLTPTALRPFHANDNSRELKKVSAGGVNYGNRIAHAKKQALDAIPMTTAERLRTFSFLARYKGVIDGKRTRKELQFRAKGVLSKSKRGKRSQTSSSDSSDDSDSNDKRKETLRRKKCLSTSLNKWLASKPQTQTKKNEKSVPCTNRPSSSSEEEEDGADENSYDESREEFVVSGKKREVEKISSSETSDEEETNSDENDDAVDDDDKDNENDEEPPAETAGSGSEAKHEKKDSVVESGGCFNEDEPPILEKTSDEVEQTADSSNFNLADDLFADDTEEEQFTSVQAMAGTILTTCAMIANKTLSPQKIADGAPTPCQNLEYTPQQSADETTSQSVNEGGHEIESQVSTSDFIMPTQSQNPRSQTVQNLRDKNITGILGEFQLSPHVGSQNGGNNDESGQCLSGNQSTSSRIDRPEFGSAAEGWVGQNLSQSKNEGDHKIESQVSTSDFIMPTQTQNPRSQTEQNLRDNNITGILGEFQLSPHVGSQNGGNNDESGQCLSGDQSTSSKIDRPEFGSAAEGWLGQNLAETTNDNNVYTVENSCSSEVFEMSTQSLLLLNGGDSVGFQGLSRFNIEDATAELSYHDLRFPGFHSDAMACAESENAQVPDLDDFQTFLGDTASEYDAIVPQMNANMFLDDSLNLSGVGSPQSEDFDFE